MLALFASAIAEILFLSLRRKREMETKECTPGCKARPSKEIFFPSETERAKELYKEQC